MAITDPEAIKFTNDYIRPMCENLRYMTARGSDWSKKWAELGSKFPNDSKEMVEDGRDAEGISRLTGADINAVATVFASTGICAAVCAAGRVRPRERRDQVGRAGRGGAAQVPHRGEAVRRGARQQGHRAHAEVQVQAAAVAPRVLLRRAGDHIAREEEGAREDRGDVPEHRVFRPSHALRHPGR